MKLFILITGFGNAHIEHKFQILNNNIRRILNKSSGIFNKITINISVYEDNYVLSVEELLRGYTPPSNIDININVIYKKGIVGEFIYSLANPSIVNNYDYIMFFLDDIEILNDIDWEYLLILKENSQSDIISPSMTKTSLLENKNMIVDERNIYNAKIIPQCEYFCYIMDIDTYINKYYPLLDIDNPWMWGIDLILGIVDIRVCLVNSFVIHHYYKSESYFNLPRNPHNDMVKYLDKYNEKIKLSRENVFISEYY
jgi:hypothetical protein